MDERDDLRTERNKHTRSEEDAFTGINTDEVVSVPKFIRRLFKETSDFSNEDIVWSNDGENLKITNKERFIRRTLPILTKGKDYSAFVRQLNIYGFLKLKNDRDDGTEEYYNSFFKRKRPDLLSYIKRVRKNDSIITKLGRPTVEESIAYLTNCNFRLSNEISELRDRVENQERTINSLLEILGKVFRAGTQNISNDVNLLKSRSDFPANLLQGEKNKESRKGMIVEDKESNVKKEDMSFGDMNDIFF